MGKEKLAITVPKIGKFWILKFRAIFEKSSFRRTLLGFEANPKRVRSKGSSGLKKKGMVGIVFSRTFQMPEWEVSKFPQLNGDNFTTRRS